MLAAGILFPVLTTFDLDTMIADTETEILRVIDASEDASEDDVGTRTGAPA